MASPDKPKILVLSNDGVADGYGRISSELHTRMVDKGYRVMGVSIAYDGLLPAQYEGAVLPYWVAPTNGQWLTALGRIWQAWRPDWVVVIQDFMPYVVQAFHQSGIDWTTTKFGVITPVDGAPIHPDWIDTAKQADALMTISDFGLQVMQSEGLTYARRLHCGVDTERFSPATPEQKIALREKLGIPSDAFVLASMAQNQGRKAWPEMLEGFFAFAENRTDCYYLLDCHPSSPGFDIPSMCKQFGWDRNKLIFKHEAESRGLNTLTLRYQVADAMAVLAYREGWGFPLVEAQACGVPAIAQDYCSGTEIVSNDQGVLIPRGAKHVSGWGNAVDYLPSVAGFVEGLERLYSDADYRAYVGALGREHALSLTWDQAVTEYEAALQENPHDNG